MGRVVSVDPKGVASAADIFGAVARPDKIEVSVDLVYELAVYAKTLAYVLSGNAIGAQVETKAVEGLAQLDGFRHFKEILKTPLAATLIGESARTTVAVEAEDSSHAAEAVLIDSGYFRRPNRGLFLKRADTPAG